MGESQYIVNRHDQEASQGGMEAIYYPHALLMGGQWWGIKSYRTAAKRDGAMLRQSFAHTNGFGPPVGGRVRVLVKRTGGKDPLVRYGYYTAQCQPMNDVGFDDEGDELDDPRIDNVLAVAKSRGVNLTDDGFRNFGWWNGTMVLVDFGEQSYA